MGFCLVLAIVAATLLAFLFQQMWYVSVNKTQVELEKIDAMKAKWKKEGVTRKYVHHYGHGFVQNWQEFLFPEVMAKQTPRDYTREWEAQQKKEKVDEKEPESKKRR
jgi:hypothetical protein